MTPLSPFDVVTPLGKAECVGIIDKTDSPEWCCFVYSSGEPWFFTNMLVRRFPYATGGGGVSPFSPRHINANLRKAIDRYLAAGWL